MNTFGNSLRLTTFGESHGLAIGGVIDGLPAGFIIDFDDVRLWMDRRRPGSVAGSTTRRESDEVEFLSGIYQGRTLGTPVAFIIRNTDARPGDYDPELLRPNHADYTYLQKYGLRDPRGGGRASARETACRVVAGAIAAQILEAKGIFVSAWTESIGKVTTQVAAVPDETDIYASAVRCPDAVASVAMQDALDCARRDCDTLGGIVRCVVTGLKPGVGEPVFGKLQASLAAAMMSIPAAKGFDYGDGFAAAEATGRSQVDVLTPNGIVGNHSGGIQGGISNGQPLTMRVAFKPIATMPGATVPTINESGESASLTFGGRHDVCAVPRAVPVVRAMAALTVLDLLKIGTALQ